MIYSKVISAMLREHSLLRSMVRLAGLTASVLWLLSFEPLFADESDDRVVEHLRDVHSQKLASFSHGRARVKLAQNESGWARTEHVVEWDDRGFVRWSGTAAFDASGRFPASKFDATYDPVRKRLEVQRHLDGKGDIHIQQPVVQWPRWLWTTPDLGWFSVGLVPEPSLIKFIGSDLTGRARRSVVTDEASGEIKCVVIYPFDNERETTAEFICDIEYEALFRRGRMDNGRCGDYVWTRLGGGMIVPERIAWTSPKDRGTAPPAPSPETWGIYAEYSDVDLDYVPPPSRFVLSRQHLIAGSLLIETVDGITRTSLIGSAPASDMEDRLQAAGDAAAGKGTAEGAKP